MYYDLSTGIIGFWTPADLALNQETKDISFLIEKKSEEVLATFARWLHTTDPLYFNYTGSDGFDWIERSVTRYWLCLLDYILMCVFSLTYVLVFLTISFLPFSVDLFIFVF